ncbi:FecR family protein [Sphingobacterium paludis]|uniref:FecR family protein n=1 Tax=Sphingobacterium paludis TaxID=1476465 RepID=A0A4R7CZ07_9SPHI|nr:FecR family protein [Sphingobacterium paludis]TDS13177.1 FecR family protein [Sphingobacterium paludis]
MDATEQIAELIKRHIEGDITAEESGRLNRWRAADSANEAFFQRVTNGEEIFADALQWIAMQDRYEGADLAEIKRRTLRKLPADVPRPWRPHRLLLYTGLAAVFLCVSLFAYFQFQQPTVPQDIEASSIHAGGNKAELQLSNGQKIKLRTDKEGIVLDNNLTYSDGTPLLGLAQDELAKTTASISVPAGGKYKVMLSDGTQVHLNAQSKLVYPLLFATEKREVHVEGEAYFEVAKAFNKQTRIPFIVHCKDQVVRVMGTSFNISAYADEVYTRTTLVEGSVEIETAQGSITLRPNEQARVRQGDIQKSTVDIQQYVAWKKNTFLFFETELRDLLKQLSRWYAIEVSYPQDMPPTYFYGEITREKNLAEVLRILEKAGVKFKLRKDGTVIRLHVIQS